MSIPVNALKDDELLHYATLDPAAASELARRIAEGSIDTEAEKAHMIDQIERLEDVSGELESELESLREVVDEACSLIRRAMSGDEREMNVNQILKKALDLLE